MVIGLILPHHKVTLSLHHRTTAPSLAPCHVMASTTHVSQHPGSLCLPPPSCCITTQNNKVTCPMQVYHTTSPPYHHITLPPLNTTRPHHDIIPSFLQY
ncbi:hypothetical protein E2C01_070200 [Portunus trituberculatus]|uniref:Uncharacterized protein n=1 Tax=Portunus trituberculatus TaxID=210409 RepID=A0A5B7I0N8_PORTR|nr:hypothetical protein [Portunus trituberculatus]